MILSKDMDYYIAAMVNSYSLDLLSLSLLGGVLSKPFLGGEPIKGNTGTPILLGDILVGEVGLELVPLLFSESKIKS